MDLLFRSRPWVVKYYFQRMKRGLWLVLFGLILGGLAAVVYNIFAQPVYQAATRVMVQRQPDALKSQGLTQLTNSGQAGTLARLITSGPVLAEVNARLNMKVTPLQVNASVVSHTQVIEITAVDSSAERAAAVANTLVTVFNQRQDELRSNLYGSVETSLLQQLKQVESQIDAIRKSTGADVQQLRRQQLAGLESRMADLNSQISTLQEQSAKLESSGPLVYSRDRFNRWAMIPGPLTLEQGQQLAKVNNDLEQARLLLSIYQAVYIDLSYGNSAAHDLRSAITSADLSLKQYQQIYSKILQNYEAVRLLNMNLAPLVVQIDPAVPPSGPLSPVPERDIPLGMGAGLLFGLSLAFGLMLSDETFRAPQEVQARLGLPVLAVIQRQKRFSPGPWKAAQATSALVHAAQNRHGMLQQWDIQSLYYRLRVATRWRPIKTVLVAGFDDTDTSAWLAMQLSQNAVKAGQCVLLLDANLRTPHLGLLMEKKGPGLGDVLSGRASLGSILEYRAEGNLMLVSAGLRLEDVPGWLNLAAVQDLLDTTGQLADLVVINSPSLAFAETATLAAAVDGVLLSVELNRTQSPHALTLMEQLFLSRASPVGVVIV